jgi:hypothetical protein
VSWTRRVLEIAAGPAGSEKAEVDRLVAALPRILARAQEDRRAATPETTLDALVPLGRRWLPALAAAGASLALAAFLLQSDPSEPWEASLLAQAADEAQAAEIVADAVALDEAP